MNTISREELAGLLHHTPPAVTLIEALPAPQYEAEHLPGALNLPGDLDEATAADLAPDKDSLVVPYCSGPQCRRSKTAAAAFTALGYTNVRVYDGGKSDWLNAGLPFEGTRTTAGSTG